MFENHVLIDLEALRVVLIELQAASWARNWKRVRAARKAVKEITGLDITGELAVIE